MSLVDFTELMEHAEKNKYAVGYFESLSHCLLHMMPQKGCIHRLFLDSAGCF
jgi:hypothetical protein